MIYLKQKKNVIPGVAVYHVLQPLMEYNENEDIVNSSEIVYGSTF